MHEAFDGAAAAHLLCRESEGGREGEGGRSRQVVENERMEEPAECLSTHDHGINILPRRRGRRPRRLQQLRRSGSGGFAARIELELKLHHVQPFSIRELVQNRTEDEPPHILFISAL